MKRRKLLKKERDEDDFEFGCTFISAAVSLNSRSFQKFFKTQEVNLTMEKIEKKAYEAPKLIVHGDVAELTLATNPLADQTDAVFPDNTPRRLLTFS